MEGFFNKKETESITRPDGKTYSCVSCGLLKKCESPKFKATGNFNKGILNIFDHPTDIEDNRGKAFSSKYARLLETQYKSLGINLHDDCLNTYAVKCAPGEAPTPYQIDSCRKYLLKLIKEKKPKVIVLFGDGPLKSIMGHRWKKDLGKLPKWRGWMIPDQDFKAWIIPTYTPKFIMDSKEGVESVIWSQDLAKVLEAVETPFKTFKAPEIVDISNDLSPLNEIKSGNIAFDYETTGIKPHADNHKIICASVAVSENKVYTFLIPKSRRKRAPFIELLQRPKVNKIAQNMKFEDNWTNEILKTPVTSWLWDTMLATHVLDNRESITGLKFQTYVQFGIIDYDSEISPYLKAEDNKNANAINRISEVLKSPNLTKLLLEYCGQDSIYTFRLAKQQRAYMGITAKKSDKIPAEADLVSAYQLLHDGILAFAKSERNGLRIDTAYAEKKSRGLTRKISQIEEEFFDSKFYKHWAHTLGKKPNLNSPDQLAYFLYGVKKIEPLKRTESGKGSTDEEALGLLNIPELNLMLKRNKLRKLRDTYLKAFMREQVNGIMHPSFDLHIPVTYRSSSRNPNFQNIPKRDTEAMNTVRKAVFPRKGNQLLELDYSGIEVGIAACYHKDPNMIKYLETEPGAMHTDMAAQIFKIKDFDKDKKEHSILRAAAKNGFVFPQFYGDYFKMNAVNICSNWVQLPQTKWKADMGFEIAPGVPIGGHFIKQGIKSFNDFVEHIKVIEEDFWTNRFPVYNEWKNKHYKRYLKNGWIPLKTGFICQGVIGRNQVSNYPVQGAAFHCLLWCFTELTKALEERGMQTQLVGQIHDAVVLDVYPPELERVHALVQQIGTRDLIKAFPWINIPLAIDGELCPVDGSWAEKEKWNPESISVEPTVIPEVSSKRTNEVHYYVNSELKQLWTSYHTGISKEGFIEVPFIRAKRIARKYSIEIDENGWIHEPLKKV